MGNKQTTAKQELKVVREVSKTKHALGQVTGRFHVLPKRIEDDYVLEPSQELGTGYNGSVFLAKSKDTHETFAVKPFRLYRITQAQKRELKNEVEVFLAMDHPHVGRLRDVYEDESELRLVMERLEGGELFDRVTAVGRFSEKDAQDTMYQILKAINYIHNKGIVHRDIKLENFLYDSKSYAHLKLIDFGFSRFTSNKRMQLGCGTLAYMAPEVLTGSYDLKCDLWSVGIIAFILLMGYMPFTGSDDEIRAAITSGQYRIDQTRWQNLSENSRGFVQSLLVTDPDQRLSAEQALKHPWIEERNSICVTDESQLDDAIVTSLVDFARASHFRRACMSMMAWTLSNEERAEVRKAFMEMDKDKSGTITMYELKGVLTEHVSITDNQVLQIFNALDSTDKEEVNYSDFLAAMMASRIAMHDDVVLAAFKRFDVDKSGYITVGDLLQVMGDSMSKAEARQLVEEADLSADGRISLDEFIEYVQKSEEHSQMTVLEKLLEGEMALEASEKADGKQQSPKNLGQQTSMTSLAPTAPTANSNKPATAPKSRMCILL
jgi:calcium-dependent protein kinase